MTDSLIDMEQNMKNVLVSIKGMGDIKELNELKKLTKANLAIPHDIFQAAQAIQSHFLSRIQHVQE